MEIFFFERKPNPNLISIEKLFGIIHKEFIKYHITIKVFKNPYPITQMLRSMLYFRKHQGEVNHITGDIHWAILLLDSDKTVITVHDLVGLKQLSGIKKWLYYILWVYLPFKKAKYITAISEKTKEEIIRYMPSVKNKIFVINNCVTIEILQDNYLHNNKIFKILVVGTRTNKNLMRIIEAVKDLEVLVEIVGKLESNQKQSLENFKIKHNEYINISDDEILTLYDSCDILCFPSLYEGFGMPVLEAQARNCVVLTSNISPLKEISGEGALLVDPEIVEDIRNGILKLINNKTVRLNLIEKGKKNVLNYSPEKIALEYISLYKKIIS